MQGIVCLGDATNHGGKVITASSTMFINGIQVALVGDMVSCPFPGMGLTLSLKARPLTRKTVFAWSLIIVCAPADAGLSVLILKTALSHNYGLACS